MTTPKNKDSFKPNDYNSVSQAGTQQLLCDKLKDTISKISRKDQVKLPCFRGHTEMDDNEKTNELARAGAADQAVTIDCIRSSFSGALGTVGRGALSIQDNLELFRAKGILDKPNSYLFLEK